MTEIWADVVGYQSIYEVSNYGRIRTHQNKKTWSKRHNTWRTWKQKILKDRSPKDKYARVNLWKDGNPKSLLIHRLVAFAFIPTVEGKECVNHIDGDTKNNAVNNLEWCTHLENSRHALETGLLKTNMAVKLVNSIGIEYQFASMSRASKFLGRSRSYISMKVNEGITDITDKDGNNFKVEKLL